MNSRAALTKTATAAIVVIIIIAAVGGIVYYYTSQGAQSTTQTGQSSTTGQSSSSSTTQSPYPIKISTDFTLGGKHAGFVTAIENGYYSAAGLAPTLGITLGGLTAAQLVNTGKFDFTMTDVVDVILVNAQGGDLVVLMMVNGQNPDGYAALSTSGIATMKQIDGHTLACTPGETECTLLPYISGLTGMNLSSITKVNIAGNAYIPSLLSAKVDVIPLNYNSNAAFLAQAAKTAGKSINQIWWKDYGFNLLSTCIITTQRMITAHPDIVAKFVNATLKGYQYSFQNPTAAANLMVKYSPDLNQSVPALLAQLNATKSLALSSASFQQNGYGWTDPQAMQTTLSVYVKAFNINATLVASNLYNNQFLQGATFKLGS